MYTYRRAVADWVMSSCHSLLLRVLKAYAAGVHSAILLRSWDPAPRVREMTNCSIWAGKFLLPFALVNSGWSPAGLKKLAFPAFFGGLRPAFVHP